MDRKIWILGICGFIVVACIAVLFSENVSFERKTSNFEVQSFGQTPKGTDYIVGRDPLIFNSEVIKINITKEQKEQLELNKTYMIRYSKVTEGDKGSYVLEKIERK